MNTSFENGLTTILEKNRLLRKTAKTDDPTPKLIPRPKGGVGAAGYQLMAEMGLERTNIKERMLYNNILVSEGPV